MHASFMVSFLVLDSFQLYSPSVAWSGAARTFIKKENRHGTASFSHRLTLCPMHHQVDFAVGALP